MSDEERVAYAVLNLDGEFTSFAYGPHVIRFRTSPKLREYRRVKQWDAGYLVVDARYDGIEGDVEEYIDLRPILENLYFSPDEFLAPIQEVSLA